MTDQRFPKSMHLRNQAEFDRVFASRAYAADNWLIVHACANELGSLRLGLSVSRKSGNAVVRNYWKRSIREAFRRHQAQFPLGMDLVVRPQKGATADSMAIQASLPLLIVRLAKRLKLGQRATGQPASGPNAPAGGAF
jgi:ribonuclease P protein component